MVLGRHFIEDHLDLAEKGYYVCGSRVKLDWKLTNKVLEKQTGRIHFFQLKKTVTPNALRSGIVRRFLAERYSKGLNHMRACNFAFWKKDYVRVNGNDENFVGWGYEHLELVYRFHNAGIKKKFLKMGGVAYHLRHEVSSTYNKSTNFLIYKDTIDNQRTFCENGIDKYLQS